jgi:hypothetical protein
MKDVVEGVSALDLKTGGVVLVEPGDLIPSDGDVIEGIASIDESANPHPISHRRTSLRGKFPANRECQISSTSVDFRTLSVTQACES